MVDAGSIRAGVGGWTFEPWRRTFYPDKLRQKDELNYASRQLATIEVNGTYYGTQKQRLSPNGPRSYRTVSNSV